MHQSEVAYALKNIQFTIANEKNNPIIATSVR